MSRPPFFVALACCLFAGCASNRPVVYPNAHARSVGQAQVEADIADCDRLARAAGASPQGGQAAEAARDTVRGGAMGAATGAVGGAIAGNAGGGAAIGAATGATAGLLNRLFAGSTPNPAYRNFVQRCLGERGYDVSGWN
ncbi:MAG: glycine zipper family protein [Gammaproteobacteria bacterium]